MCLFYQNDIQDCSHAQCLIVKTIKLLNTNTTKTNLFTTIHNNYHKNDTPSIDLQVQQQKDEGLQPQFNNNRDQGVSYDDRMIDNIKSQGYRCRIFSLEREVSDLKGMIGWMKEQLIKKGILN